MKQILVVAGFLVSFFASFSKEKVINLSAECEFKCSDDGSVTSSNPSGPYSPQDRGLEAGNGGMWAPLTLDLWEFGLELCSGVQTRICSDGKRATRHLKALRSGKWSMQEPTCAEKSRTLSPFDSESGAVKIPRELYADQAVPPPPLGLVIGPETKGKECLLPFDLKYCGGDCLDLEECRIPQTLCTPKPLILGTDRFCVTQTSEKSLAQIQSLDSLDREWACRSLIRSSFEKDNPHIGRCAAIRFDSPCQDWLARVEAHLAKKAKPEAPPQPLEKTNNKVDEKPPCCSGDSHGKP